MDVRATSGAAGVTAPSVISKVEPHYTPSARASKISGEVILQVIVTEDGNAKNVVVVKGLDAGLDENAIAAVKLWKFRPGRKEGKPVPVLATIKVEFKLK